MGLSPVGVAARQGAGADVRPRTLAPGDLVLWRAQSAAEIPYRLAAPIIEGVWKAGERVV